jgi:GNAT superfamily N-acetyltransferase
MSSRGQYEIRKYAPADRLQIVRLQRHLWSRDLAVNSEHLRWKYEQNPYVAGPLIYMAVHEGEVVGMRGVYGARWQVGEPARDVLALCSGDTVVAPAHRGRGLMPQIMRLAAEDVKALGYRYLFNLSASPATYLHSIRTGWRDIGPFETVARSSRRQGTSGVERAVRKRLSWLTRQAQALAERSPSVAARASARRFATLDAGAARQEGCTSDRAITVARAARPAAMAELVERIGSDARLRHVRDSAYFAWRFGSALSIYRFLYWEDGRLEGYLVLETPRRPHRVVRIVDWAASAMEPREDLLRAAIRWGRFADLRVWSATLPAQTLGLLAKYGFGAAEAPPAAARYRYRLLVKDLQEDTRGGEPGLDDLPLADLSGWDLQMRDSDKC